MERPTFIAFIGWGFQALLLAIATWGVSELSKLSSSVQDLNVKMAVVLERDSARGSDIEELKGRVLKLEDNK